MNPTWPHIYLTKILFRWKYENSRRLLIINNGFDESDVTDIYFRRNETKVSGPEMNLQGCSNVSNF